MNFKSLVLSLCLSVACVTSASAQTAPTLAQNGLQARIDHLSQNAGQNGFELGMLQTLRGVERTLQARYEFGLGQQITMLPLLRLGAAVTPNPAPRLSDPATLTRIMAEFVTDMDSARASLATAEQAGIAPFDLALPDIWFDVNANGTRDRGEDAVDVLGPIILGHRAYTQFKRDNATTGHDLTVRFDTADHAWLTAYTHMLSGVANLFLAFDPAPILQDLEDRRALLANAPQIPNFYDQDELRQTLSKLETELDDARARQTAINETIKPMREQMRDLRRQRNEVEDPAEKEALLAQIQALNTDMRPINEEIRALNQQQRLIRNEINAAKAKLDTDTSPLQRGLEQQRGTIDILYVAIAALQQKPDAARIRATHADWTAMISHNRTFWDRLAQETDNDREWIPNARQTSVLPIEIPERLAEGWQNILADAEAVLDGRLLVPHPLLPPGHGISIPAYVDNPAPLDLTEWVHGIGAYPYTAKGPRITGQSWQAFQRITQGNAAGFALFLN